eukprot:TRINITY_DN11748_c0_g1_i4.p1 TRINITY_DN11748_c0_g1~~TRINITY_DN11748_c0_g1_i4.p1  ORF type:complete len:195 (-),score=18.35 TRINITY_DN11748_c0_g1_i4:60-644(-)
MRDEALIQSLAEDLRTLRCRKHQSNRITKICLKSNCTFNRMVCNMCVLDDRKELEHLTDHYDEIQPIENAFPWIKSLPKTEDLLPSKRCIVSLALAFNELLGMLNDYIGRRENEFNQSIDSFSSRIKQYFLEWVQGNDHIEAENLLPNFILKSSFNTNYSNQIKFLRETEALQSESQNLVESSLNQIKLSLIHI